MKILVLCFLGIIPVYALDNGLGLTPPLGYNSYDHIGCCANETSLKEQGQALIDTGLHALGYKYVNMDCGWMGGRHPNGTLYESATKFPSGLRALSDWMHARGLLLGVYSDRGTHDFSGNGLGMKGHEVQDAAWMASAGVDYLKVDDMSGQPRTAAGAYADYATIRDALNKTGRPIFFSTCGHSPGGSPSSVAWMGAACSELANACRIAADVRQWGSTQYGTNKAVNIMASYNGSYSHYGSWTDPDMLYSYNPVGPKGMFDTCKGAGQLEYCTGSFCDPVPSHSVTQFRLWAVMGAPLLLSFDISALTQLQINGTYGNPEIIAVNQDADEQGRGSRGGRRVSGSDFTESEDQEDQSNQVPKPAKMPAWYAVEVEVASSACDASSFKYSRNGVESIGLKCHDATSASDCVAACCNQGAACTTWQYNPNHSAKSSPTHCVTTGNGIYGPCWIGTEKRMKPSGPEWVGGSSLGPPPTPAPPQPASNLNIWARSLRGGATAVIFVNNYPDASAGAQAMECDTACCKKAGLLAGKTYDVRDLATRKDLAPITISATNGFASPSVVPADAGSLLLKLTPQ